MSSKPHTCPTCEGRKRVDGRSCPTCEGSGVVWEHVEEASMADDHMDLTYVPEGGEFLTRRGA
jgi:DnaJ-class molecular chaperone